MRALLLAFTAAALVLLTPAISSAQDDVEVTYGGWGATGGAITWAVTAPVMQLAIQSVMAPADPEVCSITPKRCETTWWQYTLSGLIVAATIGVTITGGWASAKLAEELELSPELGWGASGGIVGIPVFGMLWLSLPKFGPEWLNTTLGTTFTLGGAFATGYYFSEIASLRGHAWPEFGFGFGGLLLGAGVGSLICGGESCAATPLGGAIGGILGIGLTTLLWGTDPGTAESPMTQPLQMQPLIQYETSF